MEVLLATEPGDFAKSLQAALEGAGCRVALVSTTDEVLSAASDSYSAILLDLDLAELDGLTIIQKVKETNPDAPAVILIKGEGEPAHVIQRGLDLGASGYILRHRLPQDASATAIIDLVRRTGSRPDACRFSVSSDFGGCAVFLPLSTSIRNGHGPRVSCSHLRVGTLDTWRLYPKCALGDEAAR